MGKYRVRDDWLGNSITVKDLVVMVDCKSMLVSSVMLLLLLQLLQTKRKRQREKES